MAEITASMVKSLRETSGAGMLDCKKALVETNGNMEDAVDWLRKKGLASAAKTDFVAKNEIFQEYVENSAKAALAVKGDVEALKGFVCPVSGKDMGTIGIIGPKRMDYEKSLNAMKTLMAQLDTIFKKDK